MDSLFAQPQKKPLADRMRPTRLSDFVGQETAVGERSPLRRMIEKDQLQSVLFYGPPGTGKTTLAQVIAHMTGDEFVAINAVQPHVLNLQVQVGAFPPVAKVPSRGQFFKRRSSVRLPR